MAWKRVFCHNIPFPCRDACRRRNAVHRIRHADQASMQMASTMPLYVLTASAATLVGKLVGKGKAAACQSAGWCIWKCRVFLLWQGQQPTQRRCADNGLDC
eukprot:365477-Chlamydomonas_euryale.AAC.14